MSVRKSIRLCTVPEDPSHPPLWAQSPITSRTSTLAASWCPFLKSCAVVFSPEHQNSPKALYVIGSLAQKP